MEAKLDSEVSKNMEVSEELDSLKRANVVREACEDLTESQKEKMESLSNGVDFKDQADFQERKLQKSKKHISVKLREITLQKK